jgi:ActR/RegA family two-component response regulator
MPDTSTRRINILLVDDHALFRESVARLLTSEPGFEVAAHCNSIDEALAVLLKAHVDIVLLDFDLGQRDGGDSCVWRGGRGLAAKSWSLLPAWKKNRLPNWSGTAFPEFS